MAGRFSGVPDILKTAKTLSDINTAPISLPPIDKRSRADRKEDLEKELAALDKNSLIVLHDEIHDLSDDPRLNESSIGDHKKDIETALRKLIKHIDEFEDLNSAESRKVALKEKELKLESLHDWKEKGRLFFFRVLASALFICTIFAVGYIEKEYDWATLPLSKYITPAAMK